MNCSFQVDLLLSGDAAVLWKSGDRIHLPKWPDSVRAVQSEILNTQAKGMLFWAAEIPLQSRDVLDDFLTSSADLWHAGLSLGTSSTPQLMDFVTPTWMFNRDASADIEATSWRVSLRACLVRTGVIRKMGFLRPEFQTIEAAALEWGHRLLLNGVFMRHVPGLLPSGFRCLASASSVSQISDFVPHPSTRSSGVQRHLDLSGKPQLPFQDELRFVYYRYGRKWAAWAMFRALMTRYATLPLAFGSWRSVMSAPRPPEPPPFRPAARATHIPCHSRTDAASSVVCPASSDPDPQVSGLIPHPSVSVLIPTVDRYPYLHVLLDQLRRQTLAPLEIIVVDQTNPNLRDGFLGQEFSDLPLKIINRDSPGQCSSRNAGLQIATGNYILLLDDDVEIPPDLIEAHVENLLRHGATISSGVAEEVGAGPLPDKVRCIRTSDVCPAGNTMIHRTALERSGLFDLAYEKGARADGDLGMRLYLAGELMVLNGSIQVLHHRAPSGGLRKHNVRKNTRSTSRSRLFSRNLPSASEYYLSCRYFSERQVREGCLLRILGTLAYDGGLTRKAQKWLISTLCVPHTFWVTCRNRRLASAMLATFPSIPQLGQHPPSVACATTKC